MNGRRVPPRALKRLIELEGFTVQGEDDYNWALTKDGVDEIVIVPKRGAFVARDVCTHAFSAAPPTPQYLFLDRDGR